MCDRTFFTRPTEIVARDLIGCSLRRRIDGHWIGGIIVETEAYLSGDLDLASHSAAGCTNRNAAMFGRPATWYVYQIHTRFCLNVVTGDQGVGSAVLIRAIEPVWGVRQIADKRAIPITDRLTDQRSLTSGPGMLCDAMSIDLRFDDSDMIGHSKLQIRPPMQSIDLEAIDIATSPRIGISKAVELPLRFFVNGNRFVSGRASDHTMTRRGRLIR